MLHLGGTFKINYAKQRSGFFVLSELFQNPSKEVYVLTDERVYTIA